MEEGTITKTKITGGGGYVVTRLDYEDGRKVYQVTNWIMGRVIYTTYNEWDARDVLSDLIAGL